MSSNVKKLFEIATRRGAPKAERKNAFSQLRSILLFSDNPEEEQEARLALEHSALYQNLDVAAIKKVIATLVAAPGITKKTADEQTAKLADLLKQLDVTSNTQQIKGKNTYDNENTASTKRS